MKPVTQKNTIMILVGVLAVVLISLPIPWAAPLIVAGLVILLPVLILLGRMTDRERAEQRFDERTREYQGDAASTSGPIHVEGDHLEEGLRPDLPVREVRTSNRRRAG